MSHFQTYQVFPFVPEKLAFLEVLSRNLWWSWNLDAIELFRRISPRRWKESGSNPIVFFTLLPQKQLEDLAEDDSFLSHLQRVKEVYEKRILAPDNHTNSAYGQNVPLAYFSMEFGIHECLPLFAGGLGVLAGDHLKAASDNGVPLIGIGLLYKRGYFHQYLNSDGWQQEEYPTTDLFHLPVKRARDLSGNDLYISIPGPKGNILAVVWEVKVGRIPLYLLDTNLPKNPHEIRHITSRLYAANQELRLAQEVLLGIGGMLALEAMGIFPSVLHMNEGHCAFSSLGRLAQTMSVCNVDLKTAMEIVPRTTVFTTHTPVTAGHDEFPAESVKPYLSQLKDRLQTSAEEILSWGQWKDSTPGEPFSMFVLGLRMAQHCNGVSELHGRVARGMWSHVWPERPEDEIPITHVTNGIHIPSWISIENSLLFDRYLGPQWHVRYRDSEIYKQIDDIYDEELWRAHEMSRSRLIRTCRELMIKHFGRRNSPKSLMEEVASVLDQGVLTIAFARRFATYKRANLILHDPRRFEKILKSEKHPVQIIIAGKAHPRDEQGKDLIKNLIHFVKNTGLTHKIIFLEDYDINIARHLVQGADIWLNTPRRPFEACGTSGIKAAVNGVLNFSILDGWWCEGFSDDRGWRIGNGEEYKDHAYQDSVESQAMYNILENDIIPCFYERKDGDIPVRWLKMMKESMKMAMEDFCAHGMIDKYETLFYLPAVKRLKELRDNDSAEAKNLRDLHSRLQNQWDTIRIDHPVRDADGPFRVGETFKVTSHVSLGNLNPDEVEVELYYGKMKSIETLTTSNVNQMTVSEDLGNGKFLYGCTITCSTSGRYGFTARVVPSGDTMIKFSPGFITWAK